MSDPQELGSKERTLFQQVVKNYENKQYKKGLKVAEQILRKKPDHGNTIAMKALIINSQGHPDDAFALAKVALKKAMKSYVCWHVYGLLYRSNKNFDEAIKAYKFALKLEPDSQQIQKDLALLQMQMRDYSGYVQSRRAILQIKTQLRQNWTALAVAQHLSGELWDAERTLTTFEDTLRSQPPKTDIEHAEATLYKNTIIAEMGDVERALEHLNAAAKDNLDRGWVMEKRAEYLLKLGRKEEAEKAYRALLDRNAEYRAYYDGLIAAKEIEESDHQTLKGLYDEYAEKNPRGDAARRIPLDFLEGDDFREAADRYLLSMLRKGVPSTFANIKVLYGTSDKRNAIQDLVEGYASGKGLPHLNGSADKQDQEMPDQLQLSIHYFLAQHYNYNLSRNLTKAMKHIDEAIESAPQSVDYHMTKARIWKHFGNIQVASETMEHARTLDTRDRYINTKAAKYQLRNNENEAAIQNMAKFTRNEAVGGPLGDLHDMQCQWYIYEDGMSYLRQGQLGLALKRFSSIQSIFEVWQEDQFDFHSFSLRKGQIRAYVDMIRWEDHLREHPFFARAAIAAAEIYIKLHDDPDLVHGPLTNSINGEKASAAERKKAQKKARKEKEKVAQAEAEKKDTKKGAAIDPNGEPRKEDKDPKGDLLLQTSDPLGEAMKFVSPLLEFCPKSLKAQQAAFRVLVRRGKWLLSLRSLLAAYSMAPSDPTTHYHSVLLRSKIATKQPLLPSNILQIFESEFSSLVSNVTDLNKFNNDFLQTHNESAPHVQTVLQVRFEILDPDSKVKCSQDMIRTLALKGDLKDARRGLDILREWRAERRYVDDYTAAAKARYPEASVFGTGKVS